MDSGRYDLQQGWDNNNSAPEGYGAVREPNFRNGGSYDARRFLDERHSRDNIYSRNSFHNENLDRENYPPPPPPHPSVGSWPQSRRRGFEEEFPSERESRRHNVDHYREVDSYHDPERESFQDFDKFRDGYRNVDNYRDREKRERDGYNDDSDVRSRVSHPSREVSRERDYDYGRQSYDSDYDRGSRRDGNWRSRGSRDRERDQSPYRRHDRERDQSPCRRHERSRSRSCGRDDHSRSRSPRSRSYSRSHREDSFDDARYDRSEKRRRQRDCYSVAPSATVVVRGLSPKTTEEELYQILVEWGPLCHVRIIKERNSGSSRGFAFLDFPSVETACAMMDKVGEDGLVVDGRKLFFEYSSKPTGSFGQEGSTKSSYIHHRSITVPCDWMCTSCRYINFARRTSCFQCNDPRSEDAPPADISHSSAIQSGKKGSELGPTHVLVVRGLDENADEEMLRYEFSKHAPIKDLRLVRDKFTHVSRGFAFVHFHSVDDASKALQITNGTTLEKNGQILRVAYAKSVLGSGAGAPQSSSLAAAAIEAATFSQQYDGVGWAPKEYNPDEKQSVGQSVQQKEGSSAPQSGFVWDEASGYYYDAASGFYYDGNSGLYYDGNGGLWYTFDQQKQQYIPCTNQTDNKTSTAQPDPSKDGSNDKKIVISAAATSSLPDAVQAAATAAIAAEKKEKERLKDIKLASKTSLLANKKKMTNVLTMWKQRSTEVPVSTKSKSAKETPVASSVDFDSPVAVRPVRGVIRGGTSFPGPGSSDSVAVSPSSAQIPHVVTPFKTDTSALGSYAPVSAGPAKRRFSEMPLPSAPVTQREPSQSGYRDRAAERRTLYGSSSSLGDGLPDQSSGDSG